MGQPMHQHGMKSGVGAKHFDPGASRRIAGQNTVDILKQKGQSARTPPILIRHATSPWRRLRNCPSNSVDPAPTDPAGIRATIRPSRHDL
jgi:hypothetical protein